MKNLPLLLGTVIGTIAIIVIVAVLFSRTTEQAQNVDPGLLTAGAVHRAGSATPKVTVVEFSDFQCPSCLAAEPLVKQILAKYPDTVQVVYRHLPLDRIHQYADLAARAAEAVAAGDEGLFWQYHDLLFERQQAWSSLENADAVTERLADYAAELQVDKAVFLERIKSTPIQDRVMQDRKLGQQVQITSTPSFFVDGHRVPAQELLQTVEAAIQ